jgi:hypothetical protein
MIAAGFVVCKYDGGNRKLYVSPITGVTNLICKKVFGKVQSHSQKREQKQAQPNGSVTNRDISVSV